MLRLTRSLMTAAALAHKCKNQNQLLSNFRKEVLLLLQQPNTFWLEIYNAFICCISNDKKGNRKKTLERRKMRSARAAVGRVSVPRLSSTFVVIIIWSFEPFPPEFWVRFIQTIREGFQKESCTKYGLLPTHEHTHTTSTPSLAKDRTFFMDFLTFPNLLCL